MHTFTKARRTLGLTRAKLSLWAKYSAASVVATVVGQVAFALCYWFGLAPLVATAIAWLAGVGPNYVLNRRWTWGRTGQLLPYAIIVLATAATAALVTTVTDHVVQGVIDSRGWQTALVSGAYFGTYGVLFILKFVLFDRLVFAKPAAAPVAEPVPERTPVAT